MNIISYNLIKYQDDFKISNKEMAHRLNVLPKDIRAMRRENYKFSDSEIEKLTSVLNVDATEFTTNMNERIDLRKKKIYGTDYYYLGYKVNSYKVQKINLISAIIDVVFFITLAILLLSKQIVINGDFNKFMSVLKIIFIIELCVFPFMFFGFPYLKVYFSRTYDATLTTSLKENYKKDEACGIILGCLRKNINKSTLPFIFTIFSELVIGLYCLLFLINSKKFIFSYALMVILFLISFVVSIYAFRYHFSKHGSVVRKE